MDWQIKRASKFMAVGPVGADVLWIFGSGFRLMNDG